MGLLAAGQNVAISGNYESPNICSDGTNRYVIGYDDDGELHVYKQALTAPHRTWSHYLMAGGARTALALPCQDITDPHFYCTIGVHSDGHLWIFANMHNQTLRAVRSNSAGDITAWTAATLTGDGTRNTYPMMWWRPDGTSRLYIRSDSGSSGSGRADSLLWDESGSGFGTPVEIFSGVGGAFDDDTTDTANNYSAYTYMPWVEDLGEGEFIEHWGWCWKESGALSNEHVNYAQYRSESNTWHSISGATVTLPFEQDDTTTRVGISTYDGDMLNGGGICVSHKGYPYIITGQGTSGSGLIIMWWDGDSWSSTALTSPFFFLGGMQGRPSTLWFRHCLHFLSLGSSDTPRLFRYDPNDEFTDGNAVFNMGPAGADDSTGTFGGYDQRRLVEDGVVEVALVDYRLGRPRLGRYGQGPRS